MNSFLTLLLYNTSVVPMLRRRQPYYCPVASVGQQYVRMLFLYIQLTRKAEMTDAVSLINLPRSLEKVKPGMMCSVGSLPRRLVKPLVSLCRDVKTEDDSEGVKIVILPPLSFSDSRRRKLD